ncbi:hypothetical protein [Mariprofundus ferrooxydans]|uniref:Porin domain-containing protein n=1 Tax=Mariprofundus ferrooxydans PV-1 TaxID=314345 RepID=Q0F0D4_9PROT|nr:hypothetical protein [Mariprofundus ferrooxydans]EAU55094.1 hypothetical protein SPV1_07114 [Mariprofundus ferrooxydans PV-1]KON46868.1 hypothetical protein AL013_10770 [Mariprofundus ferrooxydans]
MKAIIKSIAAIAMFAFTAPAFAGGVSVYDNGESKLKLSGKVFVDVTNSKSDTTTAGVTSTTKTQGFNLGRAYLTGKYYFNSDWMMRITTDVATETAAGLGKTTNVYLKYAYLEGKLYGKALEMRLGVSHNPWIDYEQGLWKHRYFSKVSSDEFKYDDSADIGIGFKGKLADGLIGYWVTAVNGGGYGNLTKSNGIDYKSRVSIYPIEGLTIDLGYNTGYRGKKTFVANVATNPLKQSMYQIMVTYGTHDFRIGANYISNKDKASKNIDAKTAALWGWANVGNGFGVVGRYEQEKSNTLVAGAIPAGQAKQKRTRFLAGVSYDPTKHVTFTLGYIQDKTTALAHVVGDIAKTTQIGVWSQYTY